MYKIKIEVIKIYFDEELAKKFDINSVYLMRKVEKSLISLEFDRL